VNFGQGVACAGGLFSSSARECEQGHDWPYCLVSAFLFDVSIITRQLHLHLDAAAFYFFLRASAE